MSESNDSLTLQLLDLSLQLVPLVSELNGM